MAEALDLDLFLEKLAGEGRMDSSGVFTLDPVQAQKKLRRYQLQYAYAFVGAFLAAASLAGSSCVQVEVDAQRLVIHWSSPLLTAAQLNRLLSFLLNDGAPRYLRELALGVNSALALRPTRLELASGTFRQHFRGDRQWQTEESESVAGLTLELDYPPRTRLQRVLQRELPEAQLIQRSCVFAAPYIEINQRRLSLENPAGQCLITAILEGGSPATMSRLRASLPASELHLTFAGEGPHCGVFALYLERPVSVGWVVDGLTFPVPHLEQPGAWGVLLAPQLRRDLSAFSLLEDQAYREISEVVPALFQSILEYYCEAWDGLDVQVQRATAGVLNRFALLKITNQQVFVAHDLLARVVRCYDDNSYPLDLTYFEAAYAIWLLNQRESLQDDDYHVREYFHAFSIKVKSTYQLQLDLAHIGPYRGTFRVSQASNAALGESFLNMVAQLDRLILGENHPIALFHAGRECRPVNMQLAVTLRRKR